MIKPDLLQCFIAAADTGSFTAAGKRVGKHLATVSGNIARLEDELGVLLFDRDGKYPQLTEAGLNLYDGAKVVVDSVERFSRNASQLSLGLPASFTIAIDENMAFEPIAKLVSKAQQQWPFIRFSVFSKGVDDIFAAVRQGKVDLALTPTVEGNSQFYEFQAIGHLNILLVCAKSHPLARKRQVSNDELMAHTQILSQSLTDQQALYQVIKMSPTVCFANGYSNMMQLVESGVGWAMLGSVGGQMPSTITVLQPEFLKTKMQLQYDLIWPKTQPENEVHRFFQQGIEQWF
ncbi:LysR family transcriptional regulator [Shewanella sp. Scap07]|uniref:LysR family transcriptional regulator n=1 Tax=Shewanella sp. Scap07 TaxID=2589987 RepID=UPI0015BFEB6E|nr:LysR family transcriptional regulator [Shewanella sp. Scap07]QLE86604.1 LysR family transcriptional regulator [Shewanella sp. Scap07]